MLATEMEPEFAFAKDLPPADLPANEL